MRFFIRRDKGAQRFSALALNVWFVIGVGSIVLSVSCSADETVVLEKQSFDVGNELTEYEISVMEQVFIFF